MPNYLRCLVQAILSLPSRSFLFNIKQAQPAAETWQSHKTQLEAADWQCPHCRSRSWCWERCGVGLTWWGAEPGAPRTQDSKWPTSCADGRRSPYTESGPQGCRTEPWEMSDISATAEKGEIFPRFSVERKLGCLTKNHVRFSQLCSSNLLPPVSPTCVSLCLPFLRSPKGIMYLTPILLIRVQHPPAVPGNRNSFAVPLPQLICLSCFPSILTCGWTQLIRSAADPSC